MILPLKRIFDAWYRSNKFPIIGANHIPLCTYSHAAYILLKMNMAGAADVWDLLGRSVQVLTQRTCIWEE